MFYSFLLLVLFINFRLNFSKKFYFTATEFIYLFLVIRSFCLFCSLACSLGFFHSLARCAGWSAMEFRVTPARREKNERNRMEIAQYLARCKQNNGRSGVLQLLKNANFVYWWCGNVIDNNDGNRKCQTDSDGLNNFMYRTVKFIFVWKNRRFEFELLPNKSGKESPGSRSKRDRGKRI